MENLNAIPLSALRAIEAIARNGTLGLAADELGVTAGALSQRLAKAEAAFGQSLFVRTAAGLKPTPIFADVVPRLTHAISELSSIVADIRLPKENTLTVSVAPIFASRWLIWRINKFNQQNPNLSVRIVPSLEVINLDLSEVDVGIRVSQDAAIGRNAVKLLDQRVFPVCAPDLARTIHTPHDLLKLPVIRENEKLYGWKSWMSDQGIEGYSLPDGPTYADASLCLDAAMTGQGVFMAWETLACDALERGQVSAPFNLRARTGATYWFATSQRSRRKQNVNRFKDWLEAELACSISLWNSTSH
ncbi:transcriptional regulator, LysR family [Pseudosulfitobacter pseudonitzschiae]|uniref:LysR family transcriptional regulator n=1 Tax=Pseudosulfitobacter pseudonitzschiae TaxID=1402135 RepID=A0A073J857_9RHOB|nr:LysR substrate-binding domain-containing protein [Pseudosulfitobacter pseudonitzschiae]KEJ98109.1 LysR family transcriptional regulator [Pseudosulfitobacter pseudonitzschiae]QKS09351.1 LysR family transcriptional regulator [Pseudosulfitobacter pseudonitzschiae]SHE46902.1 transcriptional regulator, LysR family [Pseudosulfitobacter pseudonitzschiae]